MGNILLFSLIIGLAATILIVPMSAMKMKKKEGYPSFAKVFGATLIIAIVATFLFYYLTNLDQNFTSVWILFIIAAIAGASLSYGKERMIKGVLVLAGLVVGVYFLSAFLFNAGEKYESADMETKTEIQAFDETETPASVPPQFARNKMKKAFGQVPNTSYYELGNLQIQKVNGDYVYIAPVEFSDFWKWVKGDKTPGYFMLSATDSTANPKFMKQEMKYTPSSYLNENIERHIRMKYPKKIFYGDVQLEVNDEGKPFYIRTYGTFISARNGFDAEGVVLVDALTGDTKAYPIKDIPAFIDGAISPETVSLQNSYFGNFVKGFWNSKFGKSDVKLPSDEGTEANVTPVFNKDGDMYYFTDFTSPKEGVDSMLGYSMTNARTGEATYYTGNLEESYMDSQGALQIIQKRFIEKKWDGKMPVLYNFYGEASWLTPVLDSNGFLQNYFIVSAANPEIAVYADTPNQALKMYKTALQKGSGSLNNNSKAEEKQDSGKVVRVYKEKSGDYTVVSFLLENGKNYIVSSEISPLAIYLRENDTVKITYSDTEEEFLPVKDLTIEGL
ncbi:sulfite exporter TauE/SafE family protein [Rossellomorea marisflavi]|uniref:sulfite exporter TauE/SafE family protein n=1 Tax=Rossellomorea marisflavi TaxID=189381 RepID=UPI00064E7489|nr:sulfite exporter TauE/SafE family protein [Rossellomorea marisflavi]KMK92353.1 membrane protein [Rossellomorea marisflavi]